MANCIVCGAPLKGKQRKFCSQTCISKKYYLEHKDHCKARSKKYYHSHKEERNAYSRAYYQKNKERFIKYGKQSRDLYLAPACKDCMYYEECGGLKPDCEFRI